MSNNQNESNKTKLDMVKFVPVEFSYDKFKAGEAEVNDALEHGYIVINDYKTDSGIVMVLGLYKSGN